MQARGGGRIINLTTSNTSGRDGGAPGLPVPLAYPASKAALDQFCRSVALQLRELGVSIVNLDPGFVRTELVDVMASSGMDASAAIPIDVPTRAIAHLATCADPMAHTGEVVFAERLVEQYEL